MDDRQAPWRAFELGEPATPVEAPSADASGGPRATRASLPIGWVIGAVVALVLLAGTAAILLATAPHGSTTFGSTTFETPASAAADPLASAVPAGPVVEVSGAVLHPGVVRLRSGARVADAIAAAGGYSPRVDAARADRELNLARLVADGDEVRVPSRDDAPAGRGSAAPSSGRSGGAGGSGGAEGSAGPLDLNTATAAQLDTLPGIGPVTAAKIVAARATARFTAVDDLRTRKLVGASTFQKLRALVVVR